MQSFINRIIRHPLLVLMAGAALLLASHGASASNWCSGGGGTYNVSAPVSVVAGRDVAVGTVIMPWKYSSDAYWSCNADSGYGFVTNVRPNITGAASGTTISGPSGGSYIVKQTNVPGVGIAIAEYTASSPCSSLGWYDVFGSGPPGSGGPGSGCGVTGGSMSGSLDLQVAVALVKIGTITPGVLPAQQVANATTNTIYYPSGGGNSTNGGGTANFWIPGISITQTSCAVADVDVPLGTNSRTGFTGIGAKVAVTDFAINVQNCPAGMTSVRYRLELAAGVPAINATSGIVGLDATSTATGVGVQVMNQSNVAYNFSTMPWMNVTPTYSAAGNYTIPLRAAYYQAAASVTPGAANSAIMFTMQYL